MITHQKLHYQPIFAFSIPQFKSNKLIDKMVPAIQVDTTNNTIKCKDGDTQVAIVRAQHPLSTNAIIAFFQVEIQKCSPGHATQSGINIGLITKDGNPRAFAGKYMNSVGFVNGQIYLNKKKVATAVNLTKKDRIGCGIDCSNLSFFFTKNDLVIAKDIVLPEGNKWNQFYPAVALQHQQETVKCYFEKKDFCFDIDKMANQIQQTVKNEIFNQQSEQDEIQSSQIYSLISQYMLFNGYSKTLELMKQKKDQIQFEPINKLTKSIQGVNKILINLNSQKNNNGFQNIQAISDQFEEKKQEMKQQQILKQQSKIKNRMRQRIMSDVHPQMLPSQSLMIQQQNQPRRKNTQFGPFQFPSDYKMRKQSNISNISLIDDQSIQHHNIEQKLNHLNYEKQKNAEKLFQQSLTQNQKFLLNQRLQILSLIKDKKIQCAQKIIKSKIPQLYQLQPMLQPYLIAHIFLRKVIQQGANSAVIYAKTQQTFFKNLDKLFPTYDSQTGCIQMVVMRKILKSILQKKAGQIKYLKKQQFEYFAEYINSLIMKWMGVMGNSRIGVILQHTSIMLRKLQQFKGMSCGIKLLN